MKQLLAIIGCLFLAVGSVHIGASGRDNDLPNDCVIVAVQANARLETSAAWSEILFVDYIYVPLLERRGHAVTVFQIHAGGPVYMYDFEGTIVFKTHSHDLKVLTQEIENAFPHIKIIGIHEAK